MIGKAENNLKTIGLTDRSHARLTKYNKSSQGTGEDGGAVEDYIFHIRKAITGSNFDTDGGSCGHIT